MRKLQDKIQKYTVTHGMATYKSGVRILLIIKMIPFALKKMTFCSAKGGI